MTNNGDGTYSNADGVLYYLGEDGVLRANGYPDLYTSGSYSSETGDDTASADQGEVITVYSEDGSEVNITDNGDGTYTNSDGAVYYLGEDGVLRAKGASDLYTSDPTVK